jgi:hypothetical protein
VILGVGVAITLGCQAAGQKIVSWSQLVELGNECTFQFLKKCGMKGRRC